MWYHACAEADGRRVRYEHFDAEYDAYGSGADTDSDGEPDATRDRDGDSYTDYNFNGNVYRWYTAAGGASDGFWCSTSTRARGGCTVLYWCLYAGSDTDGWDASRNADACL